MRKTLLRRELDGDTRFAKSHLNLLFDKLVVEGKKITKFDSVARIARASIQDSEMKNEHPTNQVPTFIAVWCARRDSNSLPLGS